jgi:hypothetical protein
MPNIIRQKRKVNYTIIPNEMLNNPNLSFKAKAMLCYLLSKPDRWSVYLSQLAKASSDGYESVVSGMNELIANRYVFRKPCSGANPGGWEYFVYDEPQAEDEFPLGKKPSRDFPESEKPVTNKERLYKESKEIKEKESSAVASHSSVQPNLFQTSSHESHISGSATAELKSADGKKKTPRSEAPPQNIPTELDTPKFKESWNEFLQHRKEKKIPMTPTATKNMFRKFTAWGVDNAIQAIDTAISNGWTGVFEVKPSKFNPNLKPERFCNV